MEGVYLAVAKEHLNDNWILPALAKLNGLQPFWLL
jgi:hypothetical protein